MKEKEGKCFVEIYLVKEVCIAFDFAHFAILVERNHTDSKDLIFGFFGKAYREKFFRDWFPVFSDKKFDERIQTKIIEIDEAEELWKTFKECETDSAPLWKLLEKVFPRQIAEYEGKKSG